LDNGKMRQLLVDELHFPTLEQGLAACFASQA